jgi:hypothetical protein
MTSAFVFFSEVAIAMILLTISLFGLFHRWFGTEARWRRRALRNRRRHPYLQMQYDRAENDWQRFLIAQNMLIVDRNELRQTGWVGRSRYPDIWDYHIAPGQLGFEVARLRRKDRIEEISALNA